MVNDPDLSASILRQARKHLTAQTSRHTAAT